MRNTINNLLQNYTEYEDLFKRFETLTELEKKRFYELDKLYSNTSLPLHIRKPKTEKKWNKGKFILVKKS